MPQVSQAPNGIASVQYKLSLSQKRTLPLSPESVTFLGAKISNGLNGEGRAKHTFKALTLDFLESLKLAMSDANPLLEFRLGFGQSGSMYWLPWQRHIITHIAANYEGLGPSAGNAVCISSADALIRHERANRVTAHRGLISHMVEQIAERNEMAAVVEPTRSTFLLYQCFLDDVRFIRERLLPRAITAGGRAGFRFFVRDNTLHFHTPDYQCAVWQANYFDLNANHLQFVDKSQIPELWDQGLSGARVIAHNVTTGQTTEIASDPEATVRLADSIYAFDNVDDGQRNIFQHVTFNPPDEITALAQNAYQNARLETFELRLTVSRLINLQHGDLLNLSLTQNNSRASSHSGLYFVTGVAHHVDKQAIRSLYTLERGEVRGQDQSLSARGADQTLVPETKAPGQAPNILEAQSSALTKGAGKQTSAATFAVTADANTGPG